MKKKTAGQKVEELSHMLGGRFRLTSLVQKRVRDYHMAGRAFMPRVKNLDELFELVLQQVEEGEIRLRLPEGEPPTFKELPGEEAEAETETEEPEEIEAEEEASAEESAEAESEAPAEEEAEAEEEEEPEEEPEEEEE
jgi:hypothetical protein